METATLISSDKLTERLSAIREQTEYLCEPLSAEDYVPQPIVDVSPAKWHLGHTTWFFETFILKQYSQGYQVLDEQFNFIFNSYYESVGKRLLRSNRGNLTRPTVDEVYAYRHYVDQALADLLTTMPSAEVIELIEIGLQHEQQHQELLLTDLKYILGGNPLSPVYRQRQDTEGGDHIISQASYLEVEEGVYSIGHQGSGFCFDNELGVHKVYLHSFKVMDRLVTNGEYLQFMKDGGYQDFRFWLSEGWEWVKQEKAEAPLYWQQEKGAWHHFTLAGLLPVNMNEPVTHINYYEAEAYAAWKGKRLLTEFEWEVACRKYGTINTGSNFVKQEQYQPMAKVNGNNQFFGDAWEWTSSAYLPYPFYQKAAGALGEYNGKFMVNQMVLRGGSCATPQSHIRPSYRNFFHADKQWQFTGIRLAENM